MSECKVDKYSSRVCELGTKCCTVNHKNKDDALNNEIRLLMGCERCLMSAEKADEIIKAIDKHRCDGVIEAVKNREPFVDSEDAIREYYDL